MSHRFARTIDGNYIQLFTYNNETGEFDPVPVEDERYTPAVCNGGPWLPANTLLLVEPNDEAQKPSDPQWKIVAESCD